MAMLAIHAWESDCRNMLALVDPFEYYKVRLPAIPSGFLFNLNSSCLPSE